MLPVLSRWFDMVKDVDILIDEDDINREAVKNWCTFSPKEEEMDGITPEAVAELVQAVAKDCREVLGEEPSHSMLFYCWHDFQDRTLNFSLVSASHGRLPFGCTVIETGDLRLVTDRIVMLDWIKGDHYIEWECENVEVGEGGGAKDEEDEQEPYILPVFVTRLP